MVDITSRWWGTRGCLVAGAVPLALLTAYGVQLLPLVSVHRADILTASLGAALFVVAGILRLATWQLRRDAHSALAGSALVLMGLLAVPSRSLAELVSGQESGAISSTAVRGAVSLIAMALLLRALRSPELRALEAPQRLLPLLLLGSGGLFALTVTLDLVLLPADRTTDGPALAALCCVVALSWAATAAVLHRHGAVAPWAARVSPLLAGMAVAEVLRAPGLEAPGTWTLAALALSAAMGLLAVRAAGRELRRATETSQARGDQLATQLETAADHLERTEEWRRTVRHEARNTCSGLRAALVLFESPDGGLRPEVAGRLRAAAVAELEQLEQLLAAEAGSRADVDLGELLEQCARPLHALGPVSVVVPPGLRVVGDPDEVGVAVREVLLWALGPTTTTVRVTVGAEWLTVQVTPGSRTGPATSAGLRAAQLLLRRHGGDLRVTADRRGVELDLALSPVLDEQLVAEGS